MTLDSGDISVLYVDDDEDFADFTATSLERQDERFSVTTVTSAQECLERFDLAEIDCIVSDYEMHGMDGLVFLEALRADHPELPFILFTANGSEEIAERAIAAGVTDYMQKRIGTNQYTVLANRIRNAVARSRACRQAEASKQQTKTVLNVSPDAIMVIVDDECVYVNPAAVDLFNAESDADLVGTAPTDHIPPADREGVQTTIETIQAGEHTTDQVGWRVQTLEGECVPVEVTGRQIPWEGESGIIVILYEVGEPREWKQGLRETTRQLQAVLDSVDAAIWMKDDQGRYIQMNREFRDIFGIDEEAAIGRTDGDLFSEEVATKFRKNRKRAIEAGKPIEIEEEIPTPQGDRAYLNRITPLLDESGDVYATCGIATDITAQKRREEKLAYQEALFEALVEQSPDGVLVVDEDREHVTWNEQFMEMWDVPEKLIREVPEQFGLEWIGDKLVNSVEFMERVEYLYEHPEEESRDQVQLTDGRIFDRYTAPVEGDDGTYYGRVWFFRDITERMDALKQLEEQNERLEKFASVASHDLRTPLATAQGWAELARETGELEYFDRVNDSLNRMERIIEDLLWLAREGQTIGTTEVVDLREAIADTWEIVTGDESEADLVFEGGSFGHIQADYNRLRQLLENLLSNALTHAGSNVTVRVELLETGFVIEDDGPGIPESEREHVFDRGYTNIEGGTGFGLAIVKEIAEAHGWKIDLMEGETGGARFEITKVSSEGPE